MENWEKDIFTHRNKSYGSYQLRKKYNLYLFISFVFAVVLFTIPLYILFYQSKQNQALSDLPVTVSIDLSHPIDLNDLVSEPPPEVKEHNKIMEEQTPIMTNILSGTKTSGIADETDKKDSSEIMNKNKLFRSNIQDPNNDTSSFIFVDELPQFIGGNDEFVKLVRKNLIIPDSLIKKRIKGKIVIQIFISNTGDIIDVKLLSGINPSIDNEALKVLRIAKKWIPAKRAGKAIAFKYNIPIRI